VSRPSPRAFVVLGVLVAVALAVAVSPFASSSPDGLERVAADKAFVAQGRLHAVQQEAPLPEYAFPGVDDPRLATALAGLAGVLGVFAVGSGVALLVRRRARTAG
jgi:PDGLE domain